MVSIYIFMTHMKECLQRYLIDGNRLWHLWPEEFFTIQQRERPSLSIVASIIHDDFDEPKIIFVLRYLHRSAPSSKLLSASTVKRFSHALFALHRMCVVFVNHTVIRVNCQWAVFMNSSSPWDDFAFNNLWPDRFFTEVRWILSTTSL